jgi:hypothetical protein
MMRNLSPIFALLLVAAVSAPALAAPPNGQGNATGQGSANGQGNANAPGNASENANASGQGNASGNANVSAPSTGGGNPNAEQQVINVPQDNKVAREAVEKQQVLPLEAVTARVANTSQGRVLDVELVRIGGVLSYEVTVLEADGRLRKLYYNARSGALMDDR